MTLSFTQQINGNPNYFIEKIWESIIHQPGFDYKTYIEAHIANFGKNWDGVDWERMTHEPVDPKLHTIRQDPSGRWKSGMDIHMVINNRTKNRFQFAPVVKCVSVQKIEIKSGPIKNSHYFLVSIDGRKLTGPEIRELAINDGFDSPKEFFDYFNKDFTGVLIHWTDLKY